MERNENENANKKGVSQKCWLHSGLGDSTINTTELYQYRPNNSSNKTAKHHIYYDG